jgi:hypothetical protein
MSVREPEGRSGGWTERPSSRPVLTCIRHGAGAGAVMEASEIR